MDKKTFLVEIGTEELPEKNLKNLAEEFFKKMKIELDKVGIPYEGMRWFASSRRLAIKVLLIKNNQTYNLREKNPLSLKIFGEKKRNIFFLGKMLITTLLNKGKCFRRKNHPIDNREKNQSIEELLYLATKYAVRNLNLTQKMRWGEKKEKFIRPVHTVTLLLDDTIISGKIFGIQINRILFGHRFIGKKVISLKHADFYSDTLINQGKVIPDFYQRKQIICSEVEKIAHDLHGLVDLNDDLLEEVTSMIEWPVVLLARFSKSFLNIPKEIVIHILKNTQKCFPVYSKSKKRLLPYFIFVSNTFSKDPRKIILGNERTLHSRLSDAKFFFDLDRKKKLEENLSRLDKVIFHYKLGSLLDKSKRISLLSYWIAKRIGADLEQTKRAALLSKCDLLTNMVFEFSEAKGTVGMRYALLDGEKEPVAIALKEQYYPRFSKDSLPNQPISCSLAIADKVDNLVGMFGIDQIPQGRKDPFALRRAAIGLLRILIEKELSIDLISLLEESRKIYGKMLFNSSLVEDLISFILVRLKIWYRDQGYRTDVIDSIPFCYPFLLTDFDKRIKSIIFFLSLEKSKSLVLTIKRIKKFLSKNKDKIMNDFQSSLLRRSEEIKLSEELKILKEKSRILLGRKEYKKIFSNMFHLENKVNNFLDNIKVLKEEQNLIVNRLSLLKETEIFFSQVADLSILNSSIEESKR